MTSPEELGALESIADAIEGKEDEEGICKVKGSLFEAESLTCRSFLLVRESVPNYGEEEIDRMIVPSDKVTLEQLNKWKRKEKHTVEEITGSELAEFIDNSIGDSK